MNADPKFTGGENELLICSNMSYKNPNNDKESTLSIK